MVLQELLHEVEVRGVDLSIVGDRLRYRPASRLTPELVEGLRQHKAKILERLEGDVSSATVAGDEPPEVSRRHDNPSRDSLLNSAVIRDVGEVLELARARLGEMEHPEEAPYPPPEKGRDPLVHRHTAKARFFRDVRVRDLEKRRREGFPPWIRLVDGGGAA